MSAGNGAGPGREVRFSSYSIVSSRLPSGGYALLNPISGALDLLPDELGGRLRTAFLDRTRTASWIVDEVQAAAIAATLDPETKASLAERGHLTEMSPDEERHWVREIAAATHEVQQRSPQFMIVPTLDCNYRCTYCFERPLQNGLQVIGSPINHHRSNVQMTPAHVEAIYGSIPIIQAMRGASPGGQIVLYGGEPLDVRNQAVVTALVERGVEEGFTFSAVTNGHDLNHFTELLGTGRITVIQISVDGPKPIHDQRRIHLFRESSFDRITANIAVALAETDVEIQLRVHLDHSNVDAFDEVLGHFAAQGWTSNPRFIIYANTVYSKDRQDQVGARVETGALADRLRAMARRHPNVFTSAPAVHAARVLTDLVETGTRFQGRGTYCAANIGNFIFAPDWQIYACWESVGKACSRVGSYGDGGLALDEGACRKWFGRSVAEIPECLECAFALVCGGGCAQYSEYNNGTLYKPYCDDFQRLFGDVLADELDLHVTRAAELPRQDMEEVAYGKVERHD